MSLSKLHYVNVGPKGTFQNSSDFQTLPRDIDEMIDHVEQHDLKKLAIHFHGGLIKESSGMKIADKMLPVFHDADSHGITFVWETGLLETMVLGSFGVARILKTLPEPISYYRFSLISPLQG